MGGHNGKNRLSYKQLTKYEGKIMGNMVTIAVKINDISELEKNKDELDLTELMYFQRNEKNKEFVSGIAVSNFYHASDNTNIFVSDKGLKVQDYAFSSVSEFVEENLAKGKTVPDLLPNILLGDYKKDLSFNKVSSKEEEKNNSKVAVFGFLTDRMDSELNKTFIDEMIRVSKILAEEPLPKNSAIITGADHYVGETINARAPIAILGVLDEKSNGIVNMHYNTFTHVPVPAKQFDLTKGIDDFKADIKKEFGLKTRKPTLKP